ncbi:hypothetical protein GOBAR_AA18612 [Gossypium barbadense]|uniref:SEC63 domain-containing protein n=1 Tax=Gossypium barbadense TaxID=3634 RepID=A0A2P5XFC7_GOSBA|nr:hypothetical protein GOBAR_AA18612 [Gossypium barbadense]
MTKPTYTAIVQHAKGGKPATVFVPTRKHVRLTSVDLMSYSKVDNEDEPVFRLRSAEELKPFVDKISEETLKTTLEHRVGYLDEAHLVVVMGTQYYDGRGNAHTDYHVTDSLQMTGHASRPLLDNSGKCVILSCHAPCKEYYKKFLYEALPSRAICTIFYMITSMLKLLLKLLRASKMLWIFLFGRSCIGGSLEIQITTTQRHLSDHLSEFVENTLNDLEASKCITIEDDMDLSPSLGKIASYIYISYTNIEHFGSSLTSETKMKVLLEILASASEYANLLIRNGEEEVLRRLINHQRFSFENPRCTDPHVKANALLQAHFSRQHVVGNRAKVEPPHFTKELSKRCQENPGKNIETIFDLVEIRDDERHAVRNVRFAAAGHCKITLDRETQVEPVDAPRYPKAKDEGWWLVIGDTTSNQLVAIKRCDQEYCFTVDVKEAVGLSEDSGSDNSNLFCMLKCLSSIVVLTMLNGAFSMR